MSFKLDKVAIRYAKAAFDYLKEEKKVRLVIDELRAFAKAYESNPELQHVLSGETFPADKRRLVLDDVTKKLGLSEDTHRVLVVLSKNKRLGSASGVAERLHFLVLESAEITPLKVESPVELSDSEKKKLEKKFTDIFGKKVEAAYVMEPHLMGGLRVTAGGRTYDGTLSGWLLGIEEKLMGGRG